MMGRELRVRSPINTKQGLPATVAAGTKRKLGADSFLRRSSRGYDVASPTTDPVLEVKARWDGKILTISGVPANALASDSGEASDEDQNGNDSQDVDTWEAKWMGSPTKRRRVDRSSQAVRNDYSTNSHTGPSASKTRRSRRYDTEDLPSEKPKPKAVERLSRPALRGHSEPSTAIAFLQSSMHQKSRQTSLAPSETAATDDRASRSPSDHLRAGPGVSARSSHAPSLSPPLSSVATPEPEDANKNGDFDVVRQKDPDELDPQHLPSPFLDFPEDESQEPFEDDAERILRSLYAPLPQPQRFINGLTSHHPSKRSTATLRTIAENAQRALKIWQDEYVRLDKRTAPVSLPFPKKPCTGGRIPVNPDDFELEKHKELYHDGSKLASAMGLVLPPAHRCRTAYGTPLDGSNGGRELRRRGADSRIVDGLGISSDDAGAKKPTRARKPVRRFDVGHNAAETNGSTPKPVPNLNGKEPLVQQVEPATTNVSQPPPKRRRRRRGPDGQLMPLEPRDDDAVRSRKSNGVHRPQTIVASTESQAPPIGGTTAPVISEITQLSEPVGNDMPPISSKAADADIKPSPEDPDDPSTRDMSPATKVAFDEKKARAKSLKRSESMTAWWAQRKKKLAEDQIREMHSRGEFREGVWNVDSIKAWALPTDGSAGASRRPLPSPGAVNPDYMAYMANLGDPHAIAWMQSMWQHSGSHGYPYAAYSWPGVSPGGHYDPRMYHQAPPPHPGHGSRDHRQQPLPAPSTHSRQSSTAGHHQPLTPNHPFAHPPQAVHSTAQQAPPRQPTPQSAQAKPTQAQTTNTRPAPIDPWLQQYYSTNSQVPLQPPTSSAPTYQYHHLSDSASYKADQRTPAQQKPPWPSAPIIGPHHNQAQPSHPSRQAPLSATNLQRPPPAKAFEGQAFHASVMQMGVSSKGKNQYSPRYAYSRPQSHERRESTHSHQQYQSHHHHHHNHVPQQHQQQSQPPTSHHEPRHEERQPSTPPHHAPQTQKAQEHRAQPLTPAPHQVHPTAQPQPTPSKPISPTSMRRGSGSVHRPHALYQIDHTKAAPSPPVSSAPSAPPATAVTKNRPFEL